MFNFSSLLLFSHDPKSLSDFYSKVLDAKPGWEDHGYSGFQIGKGMLIIGPHDKVTGKNQNPQRMMFNLECENVKQEFERIKGLGATVIQEPYNPGEEEIMTIATFADPDENYFQIATPVPAHLGSSQAN